MSTCTRQGRIACESLATVVFASVSTAQTPLPHALGIGSKIWLRDNAYEKIDGTVYQQTTGYTLTWPPSPLPKFDGIVATDDAVWRGWGELKQVSTIDGEDHLGIQTSANGVASQRLALEAIRSWPTVPTMGRSSRESN